MTQLRGIILAHLAGKIVQVLLGRVEPGPLAAVEEEIEAHPGSDKQKGREEREQHDANPQTSECELRCHSIRICSSLQNISYESSQARQTPKRGSSKIGADSKTCFYAPALGALHVFAFSTAVCSEKHQCCPNLQGNIPGRRPFLRFSERNHKDGTKMDLVRHVHSDEYEVP